MREKERNSKSDHVGEEVQKNPEIIQVFCTNLKDDVWINVRGQVSNLPPI